MGNREKRARDADRDLAVMVVGNAASSGDDFGDDGEWDVPTLTSEQLEVVDVAELAGALEAEFGDTTVFSARLDATEARVVVPREGSGRAAYQAVYDAGTGTWSHRQETVARTARRIDLAEVLDVDLETLHQEGWFALEDVEEVVTRVQSTQVDGREACVTVVSRSEWESSTSWFDCDGEQL